MLLALQTLSTAVTTPKCAYLSTTSVSAPKAVWDGPAGAAAELETCCRDLSIAVGGGDIRRLIETPRSSSMRAAVANCRIDLA